MRIRRFTKLFSLALAWTFLVSGWAADLPEEPASPPANPEPERPVIVTPTKKRPRHRTPATRHSRNDRVEVAKDVVIPAGESVGTLVVIAGNATVDGTVDGDLVVLSGSATINGEVKQDLVTVLGSAILGDTGRVGQDAVVVGGLMHVSPQATVGGQQTVVAFGQMMPDFVWLQKWLSKGLFMGRPLPPQVRWAWGFATLFLVMYLIMALLFPRPVRACVEALEEQPIASFFVGLLLLVLLGPLMFLLVVSVAGILAIPFLICALLLAALFGKVAVYSYAGQQCARQFRSLSMSLPMMLVIGMALFCCLYMVPFVGFAVWGVVTVLGFGAVLLATFGSVRHEPAPAYAPTHTLGVAVPQETFAGAPLGVAAGAASVTTSVPLTSELPPPVDTVLMPRVGFWRRFCATILDFILLVMLIHLTGPLFLFIWAGYHVAMWTWRGTTIGGIVMRLKIVRVDGQPITLPVAFVRCLSSFFSAFALFLGFFWAGWDRDRQAWHDKIAGTIVVKVPRSASLV